MNSSRASRRRSAGRPGACARQRTIWRLPRRLLVLGLLAVLALTLQACGEDAGESSEPYRIGVMESLTGAGETYGTVASQAKQLALDEINAAGGVNDVRWSSSSKTPSATRRTPSPRTRS